MSFQFPHSARLTPPVCANAWKTAECDSLPGIWLAVVFLCAECVPDVSPPLFCVSLFRGVVWIVFDFVYLFIYLYYDALKGLWCVDWKWNPPPHFTIHPSIHPSSRGRGVCGGRSREEGGLADAKTALLPDWAKSERYSLDECEWQRLPVSGCSLFVFACAGRRWDEQRIRFPQAITRHVDWMKSTLLPVCSSSGLPACLSECLHVDL